MTTMARKLVRAVVLGALVASLAVPAAASASPFRSAGDSLKAARAVRAQGVSASAADDDIPGVPLPMGTVTGTLNDTLDFDDVYSVDLVEGQSFTARIFHPKTVDFAIFLYAPGAVDVYDEASIVGVGFGNPGYLYGLDNVNQQFVDFVAPADGTYYLDVFAYGGSGDYSVEWKIGERPGATIATSKDIVSYHGSAQISGVIVGTDAAALEGETVELWGWKYPAFANGTLLGSMETTTDGSYEFTVSPTTLTGYTVATVGAVDGYGIWESEDAAFIQPKVYVGPPVASSPQKRYVSFNIHGSLKPKHSAGVKSVLVKCYHLESGNWVLRKSAWATNTNYSDYTSYVLKTSLSKSGKWKFVGVAADDTYHARSQSSSSKVITVN